MNRKPDRESKIVSERERERTIWKKDEYFDGFIVEEGTGRNGSCSQFLHTHTLSPFDLFFQLALHCLNSFFF